MTWLICFANYHICKIFHLFVYSSKQVGAKDEGICAKVRVRIVQELVLTRDAFNARLEIENGENSALENIQVEIMITQTYGSGDPANDSFSIGKHKLEIIDL